MDSADESDEEHRKIPKLGHTDQSKVQDIPDTADEVSSDKDYCSVMEIDSTKRRVQPRRTSRGQHSKYGKDFVVGKFRNFEIKEEEEDEFIDEIIAGNRKQTQTEIHTGLRPASGLRPSGSGRGRGRPRKFKVDDPKVDSVSESENDASLSLKIPTKTYEKKTSTAKIDKNCPTLTTEEVDSNQGVMRKSDVKVEKIVNGVSVKVVVKTEKDLTSNEESGNQEHQNEGPLSEMETGEILGTVSESDSHVTVPNGILVIDSTNKDKSRFEENFQNTNDLIGEILNEVKKVEDENNEISQQPFNDHHMEGEKEAELEPDNNQEKEMAKEIIIDVAEEPNVMGEIFEKSEVTPETNEVAINESNETTLNEEHQNEENTNAGEERIDDKIIVVVEKEGEMYKCGICGKIFARLSYLKLHIPKHSEKFKCQKCQKHFTRNESLQKHKCGAVKTLLEQPLDEIAKRHELDGKEFYQCVKCGETFDTQIEVIAHYVTHSSENMSCLKCNKTLQSGETLEDHKCMAEESENKFPCDLCNQSFTSAKYLHRHLIMHTDLFKCKKCDFCFSRKDSLQKHVMKCCPELADSYKIHSCSLCYRVFSTKAGKLNHVSKCNWVRCEKCSRVFNGQEDMDSHECYEGENVPEGSGIEFSCGKCGKTFLNNYYLQQHQAIHKETFQCGVCSKYLKSQEDLFAHATICQMIQKIRADGEVNCDQCEQVFKKPKDLRLHYHMHTHPYSCVNCEKRFMKESGLLVHNCKLSDGSFECKECHKNFTSSRFLTRHMATTHGKEIFKCKTCNKGFSRRVKYQNHVCKLEDGTYGNVVLKTGKFEVMNRLCCDTCGKTFSSRSNLNKHIVSHGEKLFRCLHCGKRFHYENYLREHISSVHLNLHKYQCTDCGKTMKSKTGLIAHVKQFHIANTETFTCEVCGKLFKQKGNLNTHMYSHVTARNFSCQYCHKTFKYPDQLSRHRLVHTMLNKLQCSYCDKKFVKEYELKRHEMIFHSGLIYVCNVCYARCGHKHTLIRHYKRKHPDQVDVLSVPQVLDGMLKRVEELPDHGTMESLEVDSNPLIPNINMINEANINIMNGGPVMPPQDAAEVLHSLSSAAAIIEPHSENREAKLEPSLIGGISEGNQTIQIRLQPNNEIQQIHQNTIQLPQEQIRTTDPSQLQFEVRLAETDETIATAAQDIAEENKMIENTITLDNGMININGQYIPISNLQAIPQEGESGDAGDGQIVILQIWDPQGDDKGPQEQLVQIQTDHGENVVALQDETNLIQPI